MAALEERIPLLADAEQPAIDDLRDLQQEFEQEYPLRTPSREVEVSENASRRTRRKHYSGNEMIVAVFVVAFDTKKGNIVEWKHPEAVNLEGVEFKSLASGLHHVAKDFIYFKQNQLFGLSCFEKIPVASVEERGARMKSVGILAVGYSDLHFHMDFLQRQVRTQVETPGHYGSLEEYFRHYQSPRQPISRPIAASDSSSHGTEDLPPMTITHPAGCFTQFLQFFGPKIFILWRLALLKKRIILFSPPPIGVVCYRVYCACLLASHVLATELNTDSNPQFYVNVADIDQLKTVGNYIACTTEKIFQSKRDLFDVFVDNQNITTTQPRLEPVLRLTLADEQRYQHLSNVRSNQLITAGGVGAGRSWDDELGFAEFFQEQNSQLFRTVMDAASSEDHVLTVEMVSSLGLDPVRDQVFLTELASVYGLNVTVQRQTSMFDFFSCCV